MEALAFDLMSPAAIAQQIDEARQLFYADRPDAAVAQARQARDAARARVADIESRDPPEHDAGALREARALEARALLLLTRCARRIDHIDQGLTYVYAGMAAAHAAGDDRLHCQLHAQYVHLLATLGQNEEALEQGYAALRMAVQHNDAPSQACAWLALGHVHWAMQQWQDGHDAYHRSFTWAQTCSDKELIGLSSNGMAAMEDQFAKMARSAGRLDDAREHQRRCGEGVLAFARCSKDIGDRYNTWSAEHNHACFLFGAGQHDAARAQLHRHLEDLAGAGDAGFRRLLTLRQLGDIDLATGDVPAALAKLTEAMELAEHLQLPMFGIGVCLSLVSACEKQGDLATALSHHRRYHELYVKLASNKAQAHARAIAVKFETEKAQAVAEAQRLRAELLEKTNTSLSRQAETLTRASMEDALTGIANRRRFDQAMRDDLPAADAAQPYSLALLDIDHFKRINDGFSHQMGDEVLRRLGAILARSCRRGDLAARYGGEEFVLILRGLDAEAAQRACERVRFAVEAADWAELHPELRVTVSIGVAHHDEASQALAPAALLALADSRLYAAKHGGRNRVVDQGPAMASNVPH